MAGWRRAAKARFEYDFLGFGRKAIPDGLGLRDGAETIPLGFLETGVPNKRRFVDFEDIVNVAVDIVWIGVVVIASGVMFVDLARARSGDSLLGSELCIILL